MNNTTYVINTASYIIHDKPDTRHPVRRLQEEGGEVLAVNDLLQIALGKNEELEKNIQEYGLQFLTNLHSVSDIVESLHIDQLEATKLLAMLSLGRRLYAAPQGSLIQIRGIEDVFQHFRAMSHLAKEQLRVALINSRYQLIHEETLAIGSTEYLHINAKDVFQSAVERRVSAIILVHNHPSGDPTPSESDQSFTIEMQKASKILGIELLDHVIIGHDTYSSCITSESK